MLELGEFFIKILFFFIIVLFFIILLLPIIILIKEKKLEEEIEEAEKIAENIKLLEASPAYKMSKVEVLKK